MSSRDWPWGVIRVKKEFSYGGCSFNVGDAIGKQRYNFNPLCKQSCTACIWDPDHFLDFNDGKPVIWTGLQESMGFTDFETKEPLTSLEGYIEFILTDGRPRYELANALPE